VYRAFTDVGKLREAVDALRHDHAPPAQALFQEDNI
jgi:hypothetical protein